MLNPSRRVALFGWLALLAACTGQPSGAPSQPALPSASAASSTAGGAPAACESDQLGCAVIAEGDPIRIGTALTLTGPDAARGLDSQYGAQVALNLRGEVLGHEVELVNQDDRCSADGGTAAATLLQEIGGLVGVVGTSCSAAAIPAAQLLSEQGILLISPTNTEPSLTERESHEAFYARVALNDEMQAATMAEFACSELALATAATIHDGSAHAVRLEDVFTTEFEERCSGEVTAREAVLEGQEDFAEVLAEIATSHDAGPPELLYVPVSAEQTVLIARQASRTAGMEETFLAGIRTGRDGRDASGLISEAGEALDGMYLSGPGVTLGGDFYTSIFLEEYANVSAVDEPLSSSHGHAYDAVNLLLDAVESVAIESDGALYVPRTQLLEALQRVRGYRGLTGDLSCKPDGDCADPEISVWQVADGEFQAAWP